jgi:pimeloyl-ACP methyl ester carboxylesterase
MESIPYLHATNQGAGHPVILIHGTSAASNIWHNQVNALITNNFSTYLVDLPGHGKSYHPQHPQEYDALTAYTWLESWVESLSLTNPVTLIGHSLGGFFCLWHSLQHPASIASLVLIDPYYSPSQLPAIIRNNRNFADIGGKIQKWAPEWLAEKALVLDPTDKPALEPADRRQIAANYKTASPHVYHLVQSAPDLIDCLGDIDIPSLIIWGERDFTLIPSSFQKMVERMPRSSGFRVPRCGHQPHLCRPSVVNEQILFFLKSNTREHLT